MQFEHCICRQQRGRYCTGSPILTLAPCCTGKTVGFWTEIKMHSRKLDWMLALVRRQECLKPNAQELDKWCTTDLFMTQVRS